MKRGVSGRDEAANQLAVLRQLNQQAAAELLGWTSRGLRDSDAPRDEKTRSYDGRKLVKWALERERAKRPTVDLKQVEYELRQEMLRERRRKNDVEAGLLDNKAKLRDQLRAVGKRLLEGVKGLGHRFGPDVEQAVLRIILDARKAWEKSVDSSRSPSPAPAEPAEKSA